MAVPRAPAHRRDMGPRHGYTFIELLLALAMLGILLTIALPPTGRWQDRVAVRAARDELAGAIAWTRVAAAARGGAVLAVDPLTGRLWTRTRDGEDTRFVDLAARYGVEVDAGTSTLSLLHYDALGIGRAASRTFTIRRREASAGVTVSAYGRYRRW